MRVKGFLVFLSLSLMLAVPYLASAASPMHNFDCKNCHLVGLAINQLGGANVCLTCHGDPPKEMTTILRGPATSDAGFVAGDASNHYGNGIVAGDKTSHNWAATSVNPAAGAAEPNRTLHPSFYSRYGTTVGKVACSRCHNPHGDFDTNKKLLPLTSDNVTPMTPNGMCLACHKSFGDSMQSDHGLLSHPMIPDYNAFQSVNSGAYKSGLPSYDPAAPYANNVQLVNGAVTCLTCHNLHFTDSDDSTTDGPTGNPGANGPGDGLMLRGDGSQFTVDKGAMGVFPTGDSICNSCHNYETSLHGPGNDIGCLTCHGGHNYNNGAPTYYMLNDPTGRYTVDPTTVTPEQKGVMWGGNTPGVADGFCETCHGDIETDFDGKAPGVGHASVVGTDCKTCHKTHAEGSFSKPEGCTGCHGSPPVKGYLEKPGGGGPDGYANDGGANSYYNTAVYKDESFTPHGTHALAVSNGGYGMSCSVCHNPRTSSAGTTATHQKGSFQDVMNGSYAYLPITNANGSLAPAYNVADPGTCSNIYCHSDGGENNGAGVRTYSFPGVPPQWDAKKGTITGAGGATRCQACHGNDPGEMASATHDAHLNAGFSCNTCHYDTATSSTALTASAIGGTHVNGTLNVKFDTTNALKAGGAVVAHGVNAYSDATTMTCSAVYCHSNAKSTDAAAARVYKTPKWTESLPAPGPARCASCHDILAGTNQSVAHAAHVKGGTNSTIVARDLDCATCHDDTMDAGNNNALGATGLPFHVNGKVDINMNTALDSGLCSNISCHSDGNYGGTMTYSNQAWTSAPLSLGCADCHGNGTVSYPSYASGTAGSQDANSHFKHADASQSNIKCEECHQKTSLDGTALDGTDKTQHVDQTIDVFFKQGGSFDPADGAKTCSTTYCHPAGPPPAWGGTVNCGDCHAANNTLANSHSAHYNAASVGSFDVTYVGGTVNCGICHNLANGTTHAGGKANANYAAEVNFDGTIASGTYTAGTTYVNDPNGFAFSNATCASLYCHGNFGGNGNGKPTDTPQNIPEWGNTASGACGTCHDVDTTATMDGGAHDKHVKLVGLTCDYCHQGTAVNAAGGIVSRTLHANQALNWNLDESKNQLTASSTYRGSNAGTRAKADVGTLPYGSCDSIYCHSSVQATPPNGLVGVTFGTPNWNGTVNCGDCHNAGPSSGGTEQSSGSHSDHVSASKYHIACAQCHQGAGSGTTNHANYAVDVVINASWGGSYGGTAAPGDAYGSCSTVYCHSNGQSGAGRVNNTPTWGNTISDCTSCHDNANATTGLSGAHKAHIFGATATVGKDLGCEQCHADTVSDSTTLNPTTGYTAHVDGGKTIKVAIDDSTCNNIQCHSNGNFGNLVYNNPAFASATLTCVNCHGDGSTKSYPSYADGDAGGVNANSHNAHVGNSSVKCQECHEATSVDGTTLNGTDPTQHVDQGIDVVLKQGGTFAQGAAETCSATYCHGSGASPAWGTIGPLACDTCHNASSALANSHGVHYNSAAVATTITNTNTSSAAKYIFQCGNCHNATNHAGGAVSGVQAAEVSLSGSGTYTAAGTSAGTDRGFSYTAGGCNTNDCHNDGTAAKGAPNTNPTWTGSLAADCTGCHDNNAAAAQTMATGAHTKHVDNANNGASKQCYNCHNATVDSTDRAIVDKTVHVNGVLNVAILGSLDGGNIAYAGSCNAVYCHSTGQSTSNGSSATPTYATATWATPASGACGTCHKVTEGTGLTSGSHGAHLGTTGVNGCGDCHTGAADNASAYNSVNHVNKLIDVANSYTLGGTPGNGYGTCSTASCHDDGTGSPAVTPTWGTSGGCASCHLSDMVSGSHSVHLSTAINDTTISCGNCHGDAVKDNTAPVTHLSGFVNVYNSVNDFLGNQTITDLGYTYNTVKGGAPYDSCSTTYCHGDTLKYSAGDGIDTSPQWGSFQGTDPDNCDVCHGYPPDGGGSHPATNDCSACHLHVNADDKSFGDVTKHIDGVVQVDGGIDCSSCHGAGKYKDPNTNHPDHADHTDVDAFLAGKTLPNGDYGNPATGWYDVTYNTSGRLIAGCGQCHPDDKTTYHLNGTVNVVMGPNFATQTIPTPNAKRNNTDEVTPGASYSGGKCNNVYCHSDGNGNFVASGNLPVWGGVSENLTCASCHGNSPATNAHGVHEVGIHYAELYDDDGVGLMAKSTTDIGAADGKGGNYGTAAAHGDNALSTTITCFTCHSGTVNDSANADNSTCVTCHNPSGGSIVTGDEVARIKSSSSLHLNGAKNVVFADLTTFKSKAQLRDNLADADDGLNVLLDLWNRVVGYKPAAGTGYDQGKVAASFSGGTCSTVVCHNGNAVDWNKQGDINPASYSPDCMGCHTSLPK